MNPIRVQQFFRALTGIGAILTFYALLDADKTKKVTE
jgi:hypothetical protein